jgi:hypothetical protein
VSIACDARRFSHQTFEENQVNQLILILYGFNIRILDVTLEIVTWKRELVQCLTYNHQPLSDDTNYKC